jgi:hypothetical protein
MDDLEQRCESCDLMRRWIGAEMLNSDYEAMALQCPGCKSILRLVVPRPKRPRSGPS